MKIRKVNETEARETLRKEARQLKAMRVQIVRVARKLLLTAEKTTTEIKKIINASRPAPQTNKKKTQPKKLGDKCHFQLNKQQKKFRERAKKFFRGLDSRELNKFLAFYEAKSGESPSATTKRLKKEVINQQLYVTLVKHRKGYATIVAIQKGYRQTVLGTYRLFSSIKRTKDYLYLLVVTNELLNEYKKA
jgi:hypothetical protein